MPEKIVIIGGGIAGCLSAILAARCGYKVTLLEERNNILSGASGVAALLHSSGCEYPNDESGKTGHDCVHGGIAAKLCFPSSIYTQTGDPVGRVNFLVAQGAVNEGLLSLDSLLNHTRRMKEEYSRKFFEVMAGKKWSIEKTANELSGTPEDFAFQLIEQQFEATRGISGGISAIGNGINMPIFSALIESALRQSEVEIITKFNASSVNQYLHGYKVRNENDKLDIFGDQIIVACSYRNSLIAQTGNLKPIEPESVYLNAACYVRTNKKSPRDIFFTLIEKYGGMYAPLKYPTSDDPNGLAMIYHPSKFGCHFEQVSVKETLLRAVDDSWTSDITSYDESLNLQLGEDIRAKLIPIYPFLKDVEIESVILKPTVNPNSNRREVRPSALPVPYDRGFYGLIATKWTNAMLAAFEMLSILQEESLHRQKLQDKELVFPKGTDLTNLPEVCSLRTIKIEDSLLCKYQELWPQGHAEPYGI